MLYNINGNKNTLSKLDDQYASGLKIQKPSDDPIVAVRALKLRTSVTEIDQYYEKNIPDAKSWMETTESSLRATSEIITKLHTYFVQGANDTLTESDRANIAANLLQLKDQIAQQGNADYAGRYVFTGYKTDTPLLFLDGTDRYNYQITEKFDPNQVYVCDKIVNTCDLTGFDVSELSDFDTSLRSSVSQVYRLQLSYDALKTVESGAGISIKIPQIDEKGEIVVDEDGIVQYEEEFTDSDLVIVSSSMSNAYLPEDDAIHFVEDTGEIIIGKEAFAAFREKPIEVTYEKDTFIKNELRPEHYFSCVRTDMSIEDEDEREEAKIQFEAENQEISYEINFNQKMHINVQGRDAFKHALGRCIDDVYQAVSDVDTLKERITMMDRYLADDTLEEDQITKLSEIKELLKTELDLKEGSLRETFNRGMKIMSEQENVVNEAVSNIGTRYNRLELTENRLATQQTEFKDLMSQNEDADIVETVVNYNSMQTIYNASLSAAAKVVKNTLLDYL